MRKFWRGRGMAIMPIMKKIIAIVKEKNKDKV